MGMLQYALIGGASGLALVVATRFGERNGWSEARQWGVSLVLVFFAAAIAGVATGALP